MAHSTPPSYIALLGHSGSHAPQLIHSSVIFIAITHLIVLYPVNFADKFKVEEWLITKETAFRKNGWFIPEFIDLSVNNIIDQFLQPAQLQALIDQYAI